VPRRPCSELVVGSPSSRLLSRCRFPPLDRIWPDKSPLRAASPGSQSTHRPVFPSAGRCGWQGARTGGRCQCPCSSLEPRDVCKPAATTEDRYTGRAQGQSVEDGRTSRRARSFGSRSLPMLFLGQRRASQMLKTGQEGKSVGTVQYWSFVPEPEVSRVTVRQGYGKLTFRGAFGMAGG
jgi:hypothetical protein